MNKIRRLKYKKGFTLSELIVVMAIIGILLAAVAAFADPVRAVVGKSNANSDTINITKIMGDYIERRLSFAKSVTIFTNVTAGASDTNINNAYSKYKDFVTKDTSGKTKCGMLVFKYVDMNSDAVFSPPQEARNATYKLYDDVISEKSSYGAPTNPVYAEAFYGKYSYFITPEPYMIEKRDDDDKIVPGEYVESVKVNGAKKKAYLDFSIRAYSDFDSTEYLDSAVLGKYFAELRKPTVAPATPDNGIDKLADYRTTTERISFGLENVSINPKLTKDDAGNDVYVASQGDVTYGRPAAFTGSDIVIFYCVKDYSA